MNMNYIKEIAEALSDNHAVLMVGAGFSKNAEKVAVTDKKFLNWNELSDLFYETIYDENGGPGKEYNSSLRLAQEVEVTVGRPKLEKLIREAVPDLDYAPSELYMKMMGMPWKDVFTTNYDTLLERAADKVTKRRYNVVISQNDLVNSNDAPRILKLHGSFPSYRPFIITEEDYRTYPIKFAAMVNTVQQALLENVFCMIGFSCEDPNFINWIGWIHDNLGKSSSQKMYMISVSHIAEAKRKLLFERNIIVVDLQELWPTKSVSARLSAFFEELKLRVEEKNRKDNWFDYGKIDLHHTTDFSQKTEIMNKLNESYPGWIFLPWKMKNKVKFILDKLEYLNKFEDVIFEEQVNYMYEYVKLLEIAGRPILAQVVNQFWEVLVKSDEKKIENGLNDKLKYKKQVIYLHLLRSFRELADWEKYDICHKKIDTTILDYDSKQFLSACDCWRYLYRFQDEELRSELESWEVAEGDVYWPLVKASIYALVGEVSKADGILLDTLILVRKQLVKASGNEYLSSIEESIVSLINFIRQGTIGGNRIESTEECIHESDVSWWSENDKYCLYLNADEKNKKTFETKHNFDLSSTYTMHMGIDNSDVFYALEYLRFLEQTGHPFRLRNVTNTKGLYGTIKRVVPYYPHWCFMQILISQDKKHLDLLFGRVELANLSQEEVDSIAKEYLQIFQIVMKNVNPENCFWAKSIYEQAAIVLPEIIARFCYKCSSDVLDEIFNMVLDLCLRNIRTNFKGINKIFKGLFKAFTIQEQKERIEKVLQFPMEMDRMSDYCDPILYINKPKEKYILGVDLYNSTLFKIKQMINEGNKEEREVAINRLVILAQIVVLNETDKKYLCDILEEDETLENKDLLYMLDKQTYAKNLKQIFDNTLERMKRDSDTKRFSSGGNNYRDLLKNLKEIGICGICLEETFEVMKNLVLTNKYWRENEQPEAEERIRQTFLIAIGIIILWVKNGKVLSNTVMENVLAYFDALKEVYGNSVTIEMIQACFVKKVDIDIEDFRKNIWLCDEQELNLLKDFYDMLYVNCFDVKNDDMLLECTNIVAEVSICRMTCCEVVQSIPVLKVCNILVKSNLEPDKELLILFAGLSKLRDETTIEDADSEQEALYKLRCRIMACQIAKELYAKGIKSECIDEWKRISEDKDEFIEIRNIDFDFKEND